MSGTAIAFRERNRQRSWPSLREDVDGFVDAVLVAEGHDLTSFDKGQRRVVTEVVRKWIDGQHSSDLANPS